MNDNEIDNEIGCWLKAAVRVPALKVTSFGVARTVLG